MYGRTASEWHRSLVAGTALMLAVGLLGGCGGGSSKEYDELDTSKVEAAVGGVNGAMTDQKRFEEVFAPGAGPEASKRKGLGKYMFLTEGKKVTINGNTATFPVEIKDGDSSEIVATAEWTAEKTGDKWQIKTCPIPPEVK